MLLILFLGCLINFSEGIMFILIPNTVKCLREEVNRDVLLIGEFNVTHVPGQEVDYMVTDTRGEILARNDNVKTGRFSVVTERAELYEICFKCRGRSQLFGKSHQISLITMRGIELNKYNEQEQTELLSAEYSLKSLEKLAENVLEDFRILRENELKMRNTNESTTNRVNYLGVFRLLWLLATAAGNILYQYRYYKAKKIIE